MNHIINELRDLLIDNEFNIFLKSINYNNNIEYNDMNYEYFTIQWISIWIKDIDYIMKNKSVWKNDFRKILKCEKMEVRSYLIYQLLDEIIGNNIEYKKIYQNILQQKYIAYFANIQNNDNSFINLTNNSLNQEIKKDENQKIQNIIDIKEKKEKEKIDIEEMMDKIDIFKIYGIQDKKNNSKKRKFGEIINNNDDGDEKNNDYNNNKKIKKTPIKKNIQMTIEKKNNSDIQNSIFYNKDEKQIKERSERYKRRMKLIQKINKNMDLYKKLKN